MIFITTCRQVSQLVEIVSPLGEHYQCFNLHRLEWSVLTEVMSVPSILESKIYTHNTESAILEVETQIGVS